jgi:hypothetical protein
MPQAVHIDGIDKPVYFPDGMKPEDIERAIETDVLPQLKQQQQASAPAKAPAPAFGESVKRGLNDQVEGWEQKFLQVNDWLNNRANRRAAENQNPAITPSPESHSADNYTEEVNAGRQNYVERRGPDAGFDWARLGGNVAGSAPMMLLPGGGAGVAARAGAGLVTGAAQGATQFDPSNSLKGEATNTAVGAGVGALVNPVTGFIGDKLKSAYQWIAGRIAGANAETLGATTQAAIDKAVPEITQLPVEARQAIYDEAIQQVRTTGTLNAEQLARKANLIANGVTPTKAIVTRDPRDWSMERNLQKMAQSTDPKLQQVGDQLTGVYQSNDRALADQLARKSEGLPKGTQEQFGERAMSGLDKIARDSQKVVGKEYEGIHGEDIINPTPNALHEKLYSADIQDIEDPAVKTVIKTVENRLKAPRDHQERAVRRDRWRANIRAHRQGVDCETDRGATQTPQRTRHADRNECGTRQGANHQVAGREHHARGRHRCLRAGTLSGDRTFWHARQSCYTARAQYVRRIAARQDGAEFHSTANRERRGSRRRCAPADDAE